MKKTNKDVSKGQMCLSQYITIRYQKLLLFNSCKILRPAKYRLLKSFEAKYDI